MTMLAFSDVDQWFTFQESEEQNEEKDQAALGLWWGRLHRALPELGGDIEVIDTVTPLSTYDLTRRKLGMVGGITRTAAAFDRNLMDSQTSLPNVFKVGDTSSLGGGIAAVSHAARLLANRLTE